MFQDYVLDANSNDFRDAPSGVVEHGEQCAVPLSGPVIWLWRVQDGFDLLPCKEPEHGSFEALHRDSQSLFDDRKSIDIVMGRVFQKGTKSCKASVSAAGRVVPLAFQMIQEGEQKVPIQIGESEFRRRFPCLPLGKAEQKLKRVSVGRYRTRTERPMLLKMLDEEALQQRSERWGRWKSSHGCPRIKPSMLDGLTISNLQPSSKTPWRVTAVRPLRW